MSVTVSLKVTVSVPELHATHLLPSHTPASCISKLPEPHQRKSWPTQRHGIQGANTGE